MSTLIMNEKGTPILEKQDGVTMPANYSFECINNYVHCESPVYEDLQNLALGMSSHIEYQDKEINRLSNIKFAFDEWIEKTNWVHRTVRPTELGKHRADVLRERIESTQKENEKLHSKIRHIENLLADDAFAISFQTFGQYRAALIKSIKGSAQCRCKELGDFYNGEHHPLCMKGGAA